MSTVQMRRAGVETPAHVAEMEGHPRCPWTDKEV
jgi:hypothetical protein